MNTFARIESVCTFRDGLSFLKCTFRDGLSFLIKEITTLPIRVIIPFIDHVSANVVKKRLTDLSSKIRTTIQPVFVSRKLNEDLKVREVKTAIVNQQSVVYKFQCNLCDAVYVGYSGGHLHERVDGHKQKSSSICKPYFGDHNSNVPPCLSEQFHVLTKCTNKFECLIKECFL